MSQPIRKSIVNGGNVSLEPVYTLLIDGNNLLRQSSADEKINSDGVHYGAVFQFFLQIKLLLRKKNYDYVYVTFDDEDSGIMRYNIYKGYKANRMKKYAEHAEGLGEYGREFEEKLKSMEKYIYGKKGKKKEYHMSDTEKFVDENFARERDIILDMCEELCIRTLFNKTSEGDDFISYYVQNKLPNEYIVIVSTDNDLMQLISDTVCVYDRKNGVYLSPERFKRIKGYPVENVVVKKILLGDVSDNIGGIYGFSENRLKELVPEFVDRAITIEEVKERAQQRIDERISQKKKPLAWCKNIVDGVTSREYDGDFYDINRRLIDLSKPLLSAEAKDEIDAYMHKPINTDGRNFENLYQIVKEEKMEQLLQPSSFSSFFCEYQPLMDKEIKRFKSQILS